MARYSMIKKVIQKAKQLSWMADVLLHQKTERVEADKLILFDPSIESQNLGDKIIRKYCDLALRELLEKKDVLYVPTHVIPSDIQLKSIRESQMKIVCGTNLITPHYEEFSNWKMPQNLSGYRNILTLGVGWGYYCDEISKTSQFVYRSILSQKGFHSVRDSYTEKKFRKMGIENVLNTGCPSIWRLTPDYCMMIPMRKAKNVITTLTDYAPDEDADRRMLSILLENYENVYIWLQGSGDYEYLRKFTEMRQLHIIEPDLDKYTSELQSDEIDYVGTRLHAGIHALNQKVRTIILAVDNRAVEMGRDFNLPVIRRSLIEEKLPSMIQSEWSTNIVIPEENIKKWKAQFCREDY